MTVEEMDAVRGDSLQSALIAILGVGLLTFLVFRDHGHVLLVLTALGVGLAWSIGAIFIYPGYLNLITSSFISTLIGVGIAYGIHPVSEYELLRKHHEGPLQAIRDAWRHTGAGVVVAGVTTAAAFFSILMMQFPGFSEMGAVAGQGVLLCLIAMIFVLPALLALYAKRRKAPHGVALFDKVWSGALTQRICRAPNLVLAVATLLTIASLWLVPGIRFSTDIMKLLPRRAPSLQLFERMVGEPTLSPIFNLVPVDTLGELRQVKSRAESEPTIGTFRSVLDLLPVNETATAPLVSNLRQRLAGIHIDVAKDPSMQHWRQSVDELYEAMEEATDLAFDAGMGEMVEALEARLDTLDALASALATSPDPASVNAWFESLELRRQELLQALSRPAPTIETLPAGLRDRFITDSGRLVGYLYPVENIYEPEKLDAYVAASRRVSAESIGFPIMLQRMSGRITDGFYKAVGLAAFLVFTILWIDFRSLRDTVLALVPLCLGVIWMLGGMRLLHLDFNFANLVAVPLILGVGIDNGVHVIHRWRLEGDAGMPVVLQHTGRAICIASGTTMVGFGSLALADHRGMASLGQALILGVGGCLITSTVVLPNLLVRFGLSADPVSGDED